MNLTLDLTKDLQANGFAADFTADSNDPLWADLSPIFESLRIDPYATCSGRYRQYSRLVYLPWSGALDWLPEAVVEGAAYSPYDQGSFNKEYADVRYLPSIDDETKVRVGLRDLLLRDLRSLPDVEAFTIWPVYVGVHLIRLLVKPGEKEAITTPNVMHQDGGKDMHTFVHLVKLDNATGGVTTVGDPDCAGLLPDAIDPQRIRGTLRLERPGDQYVIDDQAVSHYASGITASDDAKPAVRDIILVGVSPYVPTFF